jgi:hypothetical protein
MKSRVSVPENGASTCTAFVPALVKLVRAEAVRSGVSAHESRVS